MISIDILFQSLPALPVGPVIRGSQLVPDGVESLQLRLALQVISAYLRYLASIGGQNKLHYLVPLGVPTVQQHLSAVQIRVLFPYDFRHEIGCLIIGLVVSLHKLRGMPVELSLQNRFYLAYVQCCVTGQSPLDPPRRPGNHLAAGDAEQFLQFTSQTLHLSPDIRTLHHTEHQRRRCRAAEYHHIAQLFRKPVIGKGTASQQREYGFIDLPVSQHRELFPVQPSLPDLLCQFTHLRHFGGVRGEDHSQRFHHQILIFLQ